MNEITTGESFGYLIVYGAVFLGIFFVCVIILRWILGTSAIKKIKTANA
jgi:hypothetical protein